MNTNLIILCYNNINIVYININNIYVVATKEKKKRVKKEGRCPFLPWKIENLINCVNDKKLFLFF